MSDTPRDAMHITTEIWTRARLVELEVELAAANEALKAERERSCVWIEQADDDIWKTQCGNYIQTSEDNTMERPPAYCQYCGGKLIASPQEPAQTAQNAGSLEEISRRGLEQLERNGDKLIRGMVDSIAAESAPEWIEWNGGECPVADGKSVEVRYRSFQHGDKYSTEIYDNATKIRWKHTGQGGDIIAYRVVSAPAAESKEG